MYNNDRIFREERWKPPKKTKCLERERGFGENLSVFLASNEERVKEKHKGKISLCLWVTSQ